MYDNMPADKQTKSTTNKPITPALSSRFRSAKTSVTPKLAGSAPVSPAVIARKDSREHTLSPLSERNQPSTFSNNVTPRSGARITRISTESPTSPAAKQTLSGTGSISGALASLRQAQGTGNPSQHTPVYLRAATKTNSPNTSTTRRISGASNSSKRDDEPTGFFRANDARTAGTFQSPKSTLSPRPFSASHLSNGSPRTTNSAPPSAVNATSQKKEDNFVRATEANARVTRPTTVARKQSITSMTSVASTKIRSPELLRTQSYPQPRPQTKVQAPPAKTSSNVPSKPVSPKKPTPPPSQPSPKVASPSSPSNRRLSFGSDLSGFQLSRPMLHRKSASVSSFRPTSPILHGYPSAVSKSRTETLWIPPTVTIPLTHNSRVIASPDSLSPRSASLASSKTIGTSVTSDTDLSEVSKTGSLHTNQFDAHTSQGQQSQSQPTPLAQAQLNAANARRERKVLDLEISNSSLLAINKTLEKELRKQSTELRRFRRLSRTGRISFAPSNRSVSGQSILSLDTLQEQTEDEDTYSDEEDEESEIDELDEAEDLIEDSIGGNTARSRRRARDERRLMLDLSKHQELLVDSQKLTQSIRKCLNISESLIKEGNQALKYKVGIGDVKLGGRVLSTEDFDNEDEPASDTAQLEQDTLTGELLNLSAPKMEMQEPRRWVRSIQSAGDPAEDYMDDVPAIQ